MTNINRHPFRVPIGINPHDWANKIVDSAARAFGLIEGGRWRLLRVIYDLYLDVGVPLHLEDDEYIPEMLKRAYEASGKITLEGVRTRLRHYMTLYRGFQANEDSDAYARLAYRFVDILKDGDKSHFEGDEDELQKLIDAGEICDEYLEFMSRLAGYREIMGDSATCFNCAEEMTDTLTEQNIEVNGATVTLKSVPTLCCYNCGEMLFSYKVAKCIQDALQE